MSDALTTPLPPAPKRFGALALTLVALLGAGAGAATIFFWKHWTLTGEVQQPNTNAQRFHCPMHPSVVQEHPGQCPICGMDLVPVEKEVTESSIKDEPPRRVLFYRSPMNPQQTSESPRKDEMGMDYLPVYEDEVDAPSAVPGLATLNIDPAHQQLIGLATAEVTQGPVGRALRTVGLVAVDERRVRHVNVKVSGFVERLYVDFVGKKVRKGDPLFSIYSPDLLSAQEEYLLAIRTRDALTSAGATMAGSSDVLVAAARRRLALWDVPESEIERIAQSGEPTKTLTIYSPVAGVVTKKDVVEGTKLDAGAVPYEVVDLSVVWVLADVYESDLRFVKEGMEAKFTLNAFPERDFKGEVIFIDPVLAPKTRTVKARLMFSNPTGELRPEMFGEVVLSTQPRDSLRVPTDAIIDSGTQKIVFVALGEGKFAPRIVTLGARDDAFTEVLSGLSERELVVTRANFLIDSESRLRASLAEASSQAARPKPAPQSARVLPGTSTQDLRPKTLPAPAPPAPAQMLTPSAPSHSAMGHLGHPP